ncbi:MAG TPA: diguanylate cyclase [Moraxellaceae bacterium]
MTLSSLPQDRLHAELRRLKDNLSLLFHFPGDVEKIFRGWLLDKNLRLLRGHITFLVWLYLLLSCLGMPKLYFFTDSHVQAADLRIFWSQFVALGVVTFTFAFLVRHPRFDAWFFIYARLESIALLTIMSLVIIAMRETANVRMATAVLVLGFVIVFGTGMFSLRMGVCIAGSAFSLTLLVALAAGLMREFWAYAFQYAFIVVGMMLACHYMGSLQRQDFLREELMRHDQERLQALSDELADLSLKDALTGVANRRRFSEVLQREWERGQRQQSPLALLVVDIDFFQAYNDHYGHQAGDDCLMAVAFVLQDAGRRPGDLVARYGGEEFALLLPDTDKAEALDTARRIQAFLQQAALPHAASALGMVTASIGVAAVVPGPQGRAADLLQLADRAVLAAKAEGRNRIRPLAADGRLLA